MAFPHGHLTLLLLWCLLLFNQTPQRHAVAETAQQCTANDASCSAAATHQDELNDCRLVLAARKDTNGRKFGLYANAPLNRGMPLPPSIKSEITGDLVLHLIDVPDDEGSQLNKWMSQGYLVDAVSSGYGGNYEGNGRVLTVLPGLGMMASSYDEENVLTTDESNSNSNTTTLSKKGPNVWASIPTADEANHPRRYSPLAGSFALNYNLTFRLIRPLSKGEEVLVDRSGWFRRNSLKSVSGSDSNTEKDKINKYENAVCLDSSIYTSHAKKGRGTFASKTIKEGSVLAYSPVLPLPRDELRYVRHKERNKKSAIWRDQLLLNYCFGHKNSSVLLYPYGSYVNFINHAPDSKANVRVQWSEKLCQNTNEEETDPRTMTPSDLWKRSSPEGLGLEYVALRDIQQHEEILLDYGSVWSNAWEEHVKSWNEDPLNHEGGVEAMAESQSNDYSPAYIMEDVVSNLRTAEEQLSFPYQENIFTACFYRYEPSESGNQVQSSAKTLNQATPWKMSRGLFDMTNLRPCKVISREPEVDRLSGQQKGGNFYTAIIQNRPGLPESEKIPKGVKHIVSGIPREAFRFVDKPYSTDEHLDGAFRHHIGLEDTGVFPESWLDL